MHKKTTAVDACPNFGGSREPLLDTDLRQANFRRLFDSETDYAVAVNDITHAVRQGNADLGAIVAEVECRLHARGERDASREPAKAARAQRLLSILRDHPHATLEFAGYLCEREDHETPDAHRERCRQQAAAHTTPAAMTGLPTTKAQIAMLHRLGVRNKIPADRAEASRLIDRQKAFLAKYHAKRKGKQR